MFGVVSNQVFFWSIMVNKGQVYGEILHWIFHCAQIMNIIITNMNFVKLLLDWKFISYKLSIFFNKVKLFDMLFWPIKINGLLVFIENC
jgi:hypothetical protein